MMPGPRVAIVMALLAAAGVVSCTDLQSPVDPTPDSLWDASLTPLATTPDPDAPLVTGQAAAVVQNGRTETGIEVNGLEATAHWGLFEGSCAQPGPVVANLTDYPTLSPDAPSAETLLDTELSRTGSYNVRVGSDPDGSSTIACGELVLREEV